VCGHCCSLAALPPDALAATLAVVRRAGITVVSLPLVNEWTQDRDPARARTPRWRGLPPLLELAAAGVPVALASDNVRDQFYPYGDYDLLEVLGRATRLAHLDTPHGAWPAAVTRTPADAMGLTHRGRLAVGGGADFVAFRARAYSELFARPQADRTVVRGGRAIAPPLPDYEDLYSAAASVAPPRGFGGAGYDGRLSPAPSLNGGGDGLPPLTQVSAGGAGPRGLEGGVVTDALRRGRSGGRLATVPETRAPRDGVRLAAAAAVGAAVGGGVAYVWLGRKK
jgi:hypothetical protein